MKKLFRLIILVLILLNFGIQKIYAESLNIDAGAYILIDASNGQVILEHNADVKRQYPASTTKIMTAIVALENGSLDQVITASQEAVYDIGKDGMNIGIMAGEKLTMKDLLNALLISSANETANIIAENICSTRQEFIDLMNKKAAELGAVDTHFTNTCGYHDDDHYTTARDLAIIAQYAMSIPEFREIAGKTRYTLPPTNKHNTWGTLPYTNKLFDYKSDYYEKVTGIKSGYTDPAGHNLVSSAINKDGVELLSVIMGVRNGTSSQNVFTYSRELLEYGFKNFSYQTVEEPGRVVKSVNVAGAEGDPLLDIVTKDGLVCLLPNDPDEHNIKKTEYITDSLTAPVNEGNILGFIEYERDGVPLGRVYLTASRTIEPAKTVESNSSNNLLKNPVFIKGGRKIFCV